MIEIYKITNKKNGKIYIGQTSRTVARRFRTHLNSRLDMVICRAIRKHGKENFSCKILKVVKTNTEANKVEILLIGKYRKKLGKRNVYNSADGGGGVRGCHWKLSYSTKRRISIANKGRVFTKEWKRKISEAAKKRIVSVKQKRKISESCKKWWTVSRRRQQALRRTGMKHSEATKRKMSISRMR